MAAYKEQEHEQLWHDFKKGDKAAFARIYREHARNLINYGYKVSPDKALIEDSIQDLFCELWQNRKNVSETTSIRFYLFKALRYKILRNSRGNNFVDIGETAHMPEDLINISHESYLIGIEVQSFQMTHLKDIISKLPQRQQEAINLRYYHGFSNEEIARIMGINYQSACKFIYTALRNLKGNLQVSVTSFLFFLLFSLS